MTSDETGHEAETEGEPLPKNIPWWHPASWAIVVVRLYQKTLSPMLGPCCRFTPSCSEYYILAVRKYGLVRGTLRGVWRILRCNPYCKGGEDWP